VRFEGTGFSDGEAIAWAGQADCLAVVSGRTLVVERANRAQMLMWEADAPLWSCAVSADGSTVVAGDEFGRVHVLRVCSGTPGQVRPRTSTAPRSSGTSDGATGG
jgi:hypothetical protein